ncbi:hypothetical protein QYE76_013595 [Lolium multiflorum]|uniref:CCHC-type domain-containing protein n=1 Tax=Lolium multiflorum TaxID=4521 RepID=A0AAD8U3A3_LOLMU|nr:hypothetical protein QYE76_013595 [Lolium multiflorum]
MAKGSTVPPTMEPNMSRGDKDEDEYEEEDWVVSLRDKGESVFKVICKDKIASTHFFEILTTAIESQKLIWMHENTIDKKGALEREYANDVASLKNDLEEEQDTVASLEEQLETLEVSQNEIFAKLTKESDHAKAKLKLLKNEKSKVGVGHDKLVKDLDDLDKAHKALESEHSILTKSYEQLQASYLKEHAMLPSLLDMSCDDACATNSTYCEASILKENVELRAQLDLLTSNYGKLEENHGKLASSHEDLLASHDRLKLSHEAIISKATPCSTSSITCVVTNHVEEIKELKAQVTSLKNDLVKSHEGKCQLDTMLSVQQFPNDKSGLGFKFNNKNKSNNNNNKGQVQVKGPAKIVCFKCKIEGHHVRSCPLKKKQKGKRPQAQTHIQPQVEEMPLSKKNQANAPIVEKSSEKEKKRTCYISVRWHACTRIAACDQKSIAGVARGSQPARSSRLFPALLVLTVAARRWVLAVNTLHARWDHHINHIAISSRWRRTHAGHLRAAAELKKKHDEIKATLGRPHRLFRENPYPWHQMEGILTTRLWQLGTLKPGHNVGDSGANRGGVGESLTTWLASATDKLQSSSAVGSAGKANMAG